MHFELKAIITFFATERAFLPRIIIIIAAKKTLFSVVITKWMDGCDSKYVCDHL